MTPSDAPGNAMSRPAEVFPPGKFIQDELDARGWTVRDLAEQMGGEEVEEIGLNMLTVELLIGAPDKGMTLDADTAIGLACAFGTSPEFWTNIDQAWRSVKP